MRRRTLLNATLSGMALTTAGTVDASRTATSGADADMARVLTERLSMQGMGLVAVKVQGEHLRWAGAGRRSAQHASSPDLNTPFELGSITKTFTALLLADMTLRGELGLDDAVEAVLPSALRLRDANGAAITFGDLATHRSGLPRLPSNLRRPDGEDPYDYADKDLWDFLANWKPTTARQVRWEYSNLGYGLLGEALALRHRTTFAELLKTRILTPLGLEGMRLALRDTTVPDLAPGHDAQGRPAALWRFGAMAAAGALAGSAKDLARYAQAALGVFDHPLKAAFALAFTTRAEGPNAMNPTALAWLSAPLMQRRVLTHDGGTAGYSTSLFIDPTNGGASLVLSNAAVPVQDLAIHFLEPRVPVRDLQAERRQTEQLAIQVASQAMAELTGIYALQPQFKVTVTVRDGRLFAQATGQGEFELFAAEGRRWFAKVAALEVHFEGAEGSPKAFVLHQAGQRLRFIRE